MHTEHTSALLITCPYPPPSRYTEHTSAPLSLPCSYTRFSVLTLTLGEGLLVRICEQGVVAIDNARPSPDQPATRSLLFLDRCDAKNQINITDRVMGLEV